MLEVRTAKSELLFIIFSILGQMLAFFRRVVQIRQSVEHQNLTICK